MPADNTQTKLPQDRDSAPIQVLAPDDETVVQITIATGNNTALLPSGSQIVEIATTGAIRLMFGVTGLDVTTGTRRILPANSIAIYRVPEGLDRIAITSVGGSTGFVTITKLR